MLTSQELRNELAQFTGTEQYHYTRAYTWLVYTDGVRHFFNKAGENGAYWLLDWIGPSCRDLRKIEEFMTIFVTVSEGRAALQVTDGNSKELKKQSGMLTDIQYGQWKFFMRNGVLMLPNEY